MSRFTISPAAADGLDEILAFVAGEGTPCAQIVADRMHAAILRAARYPLLGHAHPAIDDPSLRVRVATP